MYKLRLERAREMAEEIEGEDYRSQREREPPRSIRENDRGGKNRCAGEQHAPCTISAGHIYIYRPVREFLHIYIYTRIERELVYLHPHPLRPMRVPMHTRGSRLSIPIHSPTATSYPLSAKNRHILCR